MPKRPERKPESIAQAVRHYIDARPVVRDAIAMGIVNYSALTRRIQDETGIQGEEAVLVACRRYAPKQAKADYQAQIRRLLDKSKLEVRTRMAVLTLHASWRLMTRLEKAVQTLRGAHPIHILHGSESITLITDESLLPELEDVLGKDELVKRRTNLVELNIRSPDSIEDVPGILAFLASSLAGKGINFVEVISCYKDNMFLIDEADLFDAMQVLNALIRA
ncbi:MAG TPA: ACT domain-containing protein [Candidatus Thermoplasmatota archaeon]|nr:ACT domain-containing protein [Candidatus Thermoplasmatota archaeon]